MRLIEVKKQQLPYFKGFDLFGLMDREKTAPDLMLGAVSDEAEGAEPAGLLFGRTEEKELQLRWLFVDPFQRGKSYGELLLSRAFQHARDTGAEKLRVLFPKEYGYEAICRNDRAFFRNHGFHDTENGEMEAKLSDYAALTEYEGPSIYDESDMLDRLLPERVEDEGDEVSAYDQEEFLSLIHKPWDVKRVGMREFSTLPRLQSFIKRILTGKKKITVGSIGDLSFTQFRQGIELCEKQAHTGYLKSLLETPVDYFDLDVSSYSMSGEQVTGFCLIHFNPKKKEMIGELLFTADENNAASIAEMVRFTIVAANAKYPADTTLILPNEEKQHKAFIQKLFEEK